METLGVALVAMRAWSRAVRAHREAVAHGTTAEIEQLRCKVEQAHWRYVELEASTRALVTPSFGKEDALSSHLRVVEAPAGIRAHTVCTPSTGHPRLLMR